MNLHKWMGAVILVALFSTQPHAEEKRPCNLARFSVLPMTTLPDGRFTVPGAIGTQTFNFLVDTGGAVMTLTNDKVYSLGLPSLVSDGGLRGVAGTQIRSYTQVNEFSLGLLKGTNLIFYLDSQMPDGADGTLSPDIMKHFDIDIDFAHDAINLFSPQHCPGQVVYWSKQGYVVLPMALASSGHIEIPVMVDGKKVTAVLDTGAVRSVISIGAIKQLGITEKSPELKLLSEKDAKYKAYSYPFKILDFDGIAINKPRIQVVADDYLPRGVDMLIGVSVLRRLHLYIAYDEQKLYITSALQN